MPPFLALLLQLHSLIVALIPEWVILPKRANWSKWEPERANDNPETEGLSSQHPNAPKAVFIFQWSLSPFQFGYSGAQCHAMSWHIMSSLPPLSSVYTLIKKPHPWFREPALLQLQLPLWVVSESDFLANLPMLAMLAISHQFLSTLPTSYLLTHLPPELFIH